MRRFMSPRAVLIALVLAVFSAVALTAQRTPPAAAAMTTAATRFLDALDAEQRKKATYPLESEEYLRWNFIPTEAFPRNGLLLREMTEPQRKLAHELLRSGLSDRGYQTYTAIIALEDILRVVEGARAGGAAPAVRSWPAAPRCAPARAVGATPLVPRGWRCGAPAGSRRGAATRGRAGRAE